MITLPEILSILPKISPFQTMNIVQTQEYLELVDKEPESIYVLHEKVERRLIEHTHQKGQLTYVQGGIAYITVKNVSYIIPARHYVWLPAGMSHYLQVRNHGTITRSIYYQIDRNKDSSFYEELGIYPVNNLLYEMILYSERWKGVIAPGEQAYQFLSALKGLLPQRSRPAIPIALPTTTNERLAPVINYIENNYASALTLVNISTLFGMGERSLSRLFQSSMSISFLQYLKILRMVKAIELLLETNKSTSEIAFAVGYNSLAAFSKAFFQLTHSRPTAFKNL
ncbi:helix-turn-helix domain-containing protein [Pedobacter sp.]|uniref:helix-turn-helix domain-containing protein n=1 Tax=Pedobacter sp. TaxID=1411316 RepID=UPI003D7F1D82